MKEEGIYGLFAEPINDLIGGGIKVSETIMQTKTIKDLDELRLVGFRVLCSCNQYLVEYQK